MSAKVKTEHKVKHVETSRVHPDDVKPGRNSRMIEAPNYAETVKSLAQSIYQHGQLQPAEARRLPDHTLEMVAGYTRRDAVQLLRSGFTATDVESGEEKHYQDPDALLWVRIETTVGADEAFLRSIKENQDRHDTTDLQEALAQSELRTTQGWSDTQIARFYGYTNQNRVMSLEKLLTLDEATQQLVHRKKLALSVALLTADLTPEERAKVIAESSDGDKVSGPALKAILRDLYSKTPEGSEPEADPEGESDSEGEGEPEPAKEPKGPSIKRSVKDLERFIAADTESESPELSAAGVEFLDVLMLWFRGKRNDAYLSRTINEYLK